MGKAICSAIGLLLVLGMASGCSTAGGVGDGRDSQSSQSGVTAYGTIDSGISITRDR